MVTELIFAGSKSSPLLSRGKFRPGNFLSTVGRSSRAFVLAAVSFALILLSPASAMPYPGTGAPLQAANKFMSDGSDPNNPFSYPFLMDIAKSLAKSGLPSGFFMSAGENRGSHLDLRPTVLAELGLIKQPVKMLLPGRQRKDDNSPKLSLPLISDSPDPSANPLAPKLDSPGLAVVPPTPPRTFDKLTVDLRDFNSELQRDKNPDRLALTEPDRTADRFLFKFWTARESQGKQKPAAEEKEYRGSFVQTTPGALGAVEGRQFTLKDGKVLAQARGQQIVIDTPAARVSIAPGATALVELVGKDAALVRVLESGDKEHGVAVSLKNGNSKSEVKLEASDALLVATRKLTDIEKTRLTGEVKEKGSENYARGKFSKQELLEKELLLRTDLARMTPEQKGALKQLRERIR